MTDASKSVREHSMSCEYPEGCSCGAAEYNALLAELDEAKEAYDTLTGLLNKRFPPTPEGLPDFKVEDVLRENESLTRQRDGLRKALTCILPSLKDLTYKHDGTNEVAWNDIRLAEAAIAAARKEQG